MTAPARLGNGTIGATIDITRTPATLPAPVPGEVVIVLGTLPDGQPLTLAVTSRAWLADLRQAAEDALAAFRPEMTPAVTR